MYIHIYDVRNVWACALCVHVKSACVEVTGQPWALILAFHLVWGGIWDGTYSYECTGLAALQAVQDCPLHLPHCRNSGIIDVNYQIQLYMGSRDPNSGSHICTAKAIYIPSNPPPPPALTIFKEIMQTIIRLFTAHLPWSRVQMLQARCLHSAHHCS